MEIASSKLFLFLESLNPSLFFKKIITLKSKLAAPLSEVARAF